jgi:hypothetical protein
MHRPPQPHPSAESRSPQESSGAAANGCHRHACQSLRSRGNAEAACSASHANAPPPSDSAALPRPLLSPALTVPPSRANAGPLRAVSVRRECCHRYPTPRQANPGHLSPQLAQRGLDRCARATAAWSLAPQLGHLGVIPVAAIYVHLSVNQTLHTGVHISGQKV